MVVLFTVGLSISLKEVPGPDLFLAVGADKVFRVPRLPHGSHDLKREAECGSRLWPAMRRPPQQSEGPHTHRPPPPRPRPHHLPSDGLLAGPADPFGNRGNPQFVQVGLQAPQHAVQLAPRLGGPSRGRAAPRLPLGHELWRERAGQDSQGLGAVSHSTVAPGAFLPQGRWADGGKKGHLLQGPQEPELGICRHPRWSEGLTEPHWPDRGPGNTASRMLSPRPWH